MQAQTPEVSAEKATTPRYDTIVILGATGKEVPRTVDGGEVVSGSHDDAIQAIEYMAALLEVSDPAKQGASQ